jgi:hypothetical protein
MSEPTPTTQAVIILYEVFTGVMPDGQQVMVQSFRRQGEDKSMMSQIAFRKYKWQTWGPPIRLDHDHQIDRSTGDSA